MEFYTVCTDLESGRAVYHNYTGRTDGGFDWIRASASMPLVSQIVEIDGKKYLDGGISDSIPVKFFEKNGYDKIVVVLTRPKGYIKEKNPLLPIMRIKYRNYPRFISAAEYRHVIYNKTLDYIGKKEQKGEIFVIRPPFELPVGKAESDPERLKEAYEIGRKETEMRLEELKAFLSGN